MRYQNKVILGGLLGNMVEAYDISICYFLSTELSKNFLGDAQGNSSTILLLVFIAYLAKPIGAFVLGVCSDVLGRKNVLISSIIIMGLATACIGLIPNYQYIGTTSAFCFLSLRIIQSMALGSEFLNSSSLLVESGEDRYKGFRGCWSSVGVKAGYLMACILVAIIHVQSQATNYNDWLWRIPFFMAFIITGAGFYIRTKMPESLSYIVYYANRQKPSTKEIYQQSIMFIKSHPFLFYFAFFSSFLSVTTGFFFYLYIPMHAIEYAHIPRSLIMMANISSLLWVTFLIPLFGFLSDKTDRLTMLTFASAGLLILTYPFMYIINLGSIYGFFMMQLLISIPCACYYSVATVLLTELFPLQIRCTALSIVYSIAASLAAGIPPLLSNYLVKSTNYPNSPSIILMVLASIVLLNITILSKQYRKNRNAYAIASAEKNNPVFKIYYNNSRC